MIDYSSVVLGVSLEREVQIPAKNSLFYLPGVEDTYVPISESLLSKHVLLLGSIGSGKTNTFNHIVRNIRYTMKEKDVTIIFDAKGDYIQKFYRDGDIVISNDDRCNVYWNIFDEVLIDDRVEENVNEVATFLFKDKIKNSSNPFFPTAAKDIFAAIMLCMIRENKPNLLNNAALRATINQFKAENFINILKKYPDLKALSSYIDKDAAGQAQGVCAELQQTAREILIGNFKQKGSFSMRKQVREKRKKVIFVEYDLGIGRTLAPIYALLIDLAIKESLCRKSADEGNVFFVLDEFRLLSALEHMDNGINFGRSLGAKFILGLQNVDQIYDVYGELPAKSILSGCSTLISFFIVDGNSREMIKERAGTNLKKLTYMSKIQSKGLVEQTMNGNVIEDWNISSLPVGSAIIQHLNYAPFVFNFEEYK